MSDYHVLFAVSAAIIGIAGFAPYFKDVLKGTKKPHVFTWAIWSLLTGLIFFIQITDGGGAGAWVTGLESLCCFAILAVAYANGEKNITRIDWFCFITALVAIALWLLAHQPLLAVFLVIAADILGYGPTLRKSWHKPHEETAMLYTLSSIHWLLSIVALQSLTVVNWLYPGVIFMIDIILVAELLIRRRQMSTATR